MRASSLAVLPALLLATGCLQGQRVIKVNADGSGTITDTVKLGDEARGMMEAMQKMDSSPEAEKKAKKDAQLKARMAAMGEGVAFVSSDKAADGTEKTVYSFKDITKLTVDTTPEVGGGSEQETKNDTPLTFRMAKSGANSVLTVVFPKPSPSAAPKEAPKPEEQAQAMKMMKGMMAGLKMKTVLEVNGKVVKTNSPYAAGNAVTLFEIDFDQLDEEGLKKLALAGPEPPAAATLKGVKGLKVSDGEVAIEFSK